MDERDAVLEDTIEKLKNLQAMGIEYISVAPPPAPEPPATFVERNKKIQACTKCGRHEGREKATLGVGAEDARVVFISGTPAANDKAGGALFLKEEQELLSNIIKAMGLGMDEVYLTSLVRCAGDGVVDAGEIDACLPYLKEELADISPEVIVTLGEVAARLVASDVGLANLRGIMRSYDDVPVMVTHHPSAILKDPAFKREAWEDIKKVMALLQEGATL